MYTTQYGDTWDLIAKKVYNDEYKMGHLMQSNLKYLDYFIFPAGIVLETPELTEEIEGDLPPWRD